MIGYSHTHRWQPYAPDAELPVQPWGELLRAPASVCGGTGAPQPWVLPNLGCSLAFKRHLGTSRRRRRAKNSANDDGSRRDKLAYAGSFCSGLLGGCQEAENDPLSYYLVPDTLNPTDIYIYIYTYVHTYFYVISI